jgi:hypothetical protein
MAAAQAGRWEYKHMDRTKTSSNLRLSVKNLYKKYRAILILTNRLTANERDIVEDNLIKIQSMSRKVLQDRKAKLKIELKELIDFYGVKAPMSELNYYTNTDNISDSVNNRTYLYLTKYTLQKLFERYDRILPEFNSLSPHARIAIDVFGFRTVPNQTEI